jgi:hypothetical protein
MAAPTLAIGLLPSYSAIGVIAPIALLILRVLPAGRGKYVRDPAKTCDVYIATI